MQWHSVKKTLPEDGQIVQVKMCLLFWTQKEAMYIKKYFVHKGENITRWVTHWKADEPNIKCPTCCFVSYNENDIKYKYCGKCHEWHEFMNLEAPNNE